MKLRNRYSIQYKLECLELVKIWIFKTSKIDKKMLDIGI